MWSKRKNTSELILDFGFEILDFGFSNLESGIWNLKSQITDCRSQTCLETPKPLDRPGQKTRRRASIQNRKSKIQNPESPVTSIHRALATLPSSADRSCRVDRSARRSIPVSALIRRCPAG